MSEKNGSSSSWFRDTLFAIGLFIGIKLVFFNLIPYLLKNREAIGTEIAENVQDFESGIKLNSVAGDYRIYKYGDWSNETISCNVKERDVIFSGNAIGDNYQDLFDMLSSTRFTLTSKEPMILEGNVLDKRESKRIKTRLTFDGESRLIISSWDDDSGKWKKWTGNLYFEKF
jgi:hypothetical protein